MAQSPKTPLTVWIFIGLSWLIGWWQVFDGLHQRILGDYVRLGGQLGPWAAIVSGLGLKPQDVGWGFVMLGLSFIAASFGVYYGQRWAYITGNVASAISLLYLGFGTPVAALCLLMLWLKPTREHMSRTEQPRGTSTG